MHVTPKQLAVLCAVLMAAIVSVRAAAPVSAVKGDPRKPWRGGWGGMRDPEKVIQCAREIGFNALMVHGKKERMTAFCELARENGIETYYWFSLTARDKEMKPFQQVIDPADEKRLAEIKADRDPTKHGYQFGGEPVPGQHDVLQARLLCFHRPEVVAYARKRVREMLEACPALTGVAFDFFGYQNYRCCLCPHSLKRLEAYRNAHPGLSRDAARDRFSLETLVNFTNGLADYVREVRPGAKTVIHVYPVFLPDPLYGNRLDVDYCCQTVAWFFKPYWSREKIERYTRTVVEQQNRYHARQQGIPFVGVYVGRPYADKSPERLAEELRIIKESGKTTSLSVCSFNEFVKHPEMRQVVKKWVE